MKVEELGFAIRQARQARHLTQQQLAGLVGLSRTTLNQLESGLIPDLGIRKIKATLDELGLTLDVRPADAKKRPDFLKMAARSASVSYKTPLTEAELLHGLLSGKVPAARRPHFRTLLEELSPELIDGLLGEMRKWTKPGKVEKNLDRIARDVGAHPRT